MNIFEEILEQVSTSSDFHVHVTLELSNERETVWHDKRIFFSPSIKYPVVVDDSFLLDGFGVPKPAHPCTVLPLLAVLEGMLGRGGDIIDGVQVVERMNHELANDASIIGHLRNLG